MVSLEPMPAERFDDFVATSAESHAADNVASGRWLEHEALDLARQELFRLLPGGSSTPDHYFFDLKDEATGSVVGFVWLGVVPRGADRVAFVFQLFVHARYRRQGYARAALAEVEQWARSRGLHRMALNVFGSNTGAQALYRSAGYAVTNLSMRKSLSPSHVT